MAADEGKIKQNLIVIIAILLSIAVSSGCINNQANSTINTQTSTTLTYRDISVDEVKTKIENREDVVILDVRTKTEFDFGHIDGARLIPHFEIQDRHKELGVEKNKQIIVVCQMGGRSRIASEKLVELGYTNVYNVIGGMDEWNKKEYPIEVGV